MNGSFQVQCSPEEPVQVRSTHFKSQPDNPIIRANLFRKVTNLFCRRPLPSLFYQPEAAHPGDLLQLWVWTNVKINFSLGFSRAFKSTLDTTRSVVLYRPLNHIWQPDSMVSGCYKKKEPFPGLLLTSPSSVALTQIWAKRPRIPMFRFGNINLIPFQRSFRTD